MASRLGRALPSNGWRLEDDKVKSDRAVEIDDGAGQSMEMPSLTTAERDALTAVNGMMIYNETTNQIEAYQNGAWGNFTPDDYANVNLSNLENVAINTNLISDTDNTDDLGSSTIGWKTGYINDIRTSGSNNLDLIPASGQTNVTGDLDATNDIDAGNDITAGRYLKSTSFAYIDQRLYITNNNFSEIWMGPSESFYSLYIHAKYAFNQVGLGLSASYSNYNLLICDADRLFIGSNFDHGASSDPTLFIHSATSPDTDNTQWISFTHDKTDGVIEAGKGNVHIKNNLDVDDTGSFTDIAITDTDDPIVVGGVTMFSLRGGTECMSIGSGAGEDLTDGIRNMCIGASAGGNITTGDDHICIGASAGGNMTTENKNVWIGYQAGANNSGSSGNLGIGSEAGKSQQEVLGSSIFIGSSAGSSASSRRSVYIGPSCGTKQIGIGNIMIGYLTGQNSTGGFNVYIGQQNSRNMTTGTRNVFIGEYAQGVLATSAYATAIGRQAQADSYGIALGSNAVAQSREFIVSGVDDVDIGTTRDNVNHWFGAGRDAKIYYDGTNLYIDPDVVGSGAVMIDGEMKFQADSRKIYFGAGDDAEIYYDGTDLLIDTDAVGSGSCKINSLEIDQNGFLKPISSADASAPNNSIYYSTDASKLVYKDGGGTVNNLY